jgi:hypothetical protein
MTSHGADSSADGGASSLMTFQIRVPVLDKRAEIPANQAIPTFAVSITYRKDGKSGFDSVGDTFEPSKGLRVGSGSYSLIDQRN